MVSRHYKRIGPNPHRTGIHYNYYIHHQSVIRKLRMVYQSIRNLLKSKKSFPFAAVTTSLLFLNIGTAKATALQDYHTMTNNNSPIFQYSHLGFLNNIKSIYLQ